jgi:hypothetical protein
VRADTLTLQLPIIPESRDAGSGDEPPPAADVLLDRELAFRTAEVVLASLVSSDSNPEPKGKQSRITDRIPLSAIVIHEKKGQAHGGARAHVSAEELVARGRVPQRLVPKTEAEAQARMDPAAAARLSNLLSAATAGPPVVFPEHPLPPIDAVRSAVADVSWDRINRDSFKRTGHGPPRSTGHQRRAAIRLTAGLDPLHAPI